MDQFVRVAALFLLLGGVMIVSTTGFSMPKNVMEHDGVAHSILCPLLGGVSSQCVHTILPEEPMLPSVIVLVLLLGGLGMFVHRQVFIGLQRLRHRLLPPPYYQELFSSGILNSKRY